MKPHIQATVDELRQRAEALTSLINLLERYGAEVEDSPAAPVPQAPPATPPADAAAPTAARRRVSGTRRKAAKEPKPAANGPLPRGAGRLLTLDIIRDIEEPFTVRDVRQAVQQKHPEAAAALGKSSVATCVLGLAGKGWLRDAPEKDGLNAYRRTAAFGGLTAKEAAYREFRSGTNVGNGVEQ